MLKEAALCSVLAMGAPSYAASKAINAVPGDINQNGIIDDEDIAAIKENLSIGGRKERAFTITDKTLRLADINGNGIIDIEDLKIAKAIKEDNLTPLELEMIYGVKYEYQVQNQLTPASGFEPPLAKGIDVSSWQGAIDWQQVAETDIDFVIIRAGANDEDHMLKDNLKQAQENGLNVGVYWYSYAHNKKEAIEEAKKCLSMIDGEQLQYPVFFDIEDFQSRFSADENDVIIKGFCDEIQKNGYYPAVYSYASFLNNNVSDKTRNRYDIWLADFLWAENKSPSYNTAYPYNMWQYASIGRADGIQGNVDLDYSYKDYPSLMKKYKLNGYGADNE